MEKTQEKKYLKWYHKVGYGSGDIAGNCVYQLLTSFIMIYLTDMKNFQRNYRKDYKIHYIVYT